MAKRAVPKKDKDNVLHVGVDLGTSRSAVAASNGRRDWIESYVGWPKDFVAKKAFGEGPLFGAHALEKRLSVKLHRPLQHGVIKDGTTRDEQSIKALIEHLFELAKPTGGQQVYAAVGVPAEALRINKLAIRNVVAQYAHTLMIVSEPFAVAYGQGVLSDALIIDIGAGTTDFCIMHGTMPSEEDQRTILTAGDYIDEQLLALLREQYPEVTFTLEGVRQYKEEIAFVGRARAGFEVELPTEGKVVTVDIASAMRRACESIIPAIVETTIDVIAHLDGEHQERVRNNIILAGGGSQIRNLAEALERSLNEYGPASVSVTQDSLFAGADGALELARDMPEEYWEEM